MLCDKAGHPPLLDEKNLIIVKDKMTETTYKKTSQNFSDIMNEQISINAQEKNKPLCSVSPIGKRSLGRYGRKLRVTRGRGKTSTDARVKAVADIRNAISFGVMNQLMVNIVNPALIINSDATQYESAMDSSENVNIVYVKKLPSEQLDRGYKIGNKVLPNEQSISLTQFFIKYYLLISAVGLK